MKTLWIVLLLAGLGCSSFHRVADNLTSPTAEGENVVDHALSGVPGPGGVDLGSAGIGSAVTAILGLIGTVLRQRKDQDQLWEATHKPSAPAST